MQADANAIAALPVAGRRLLVVQVAALGWEFLQRDGAARTGGLQFAPLATVFPALTCPVQATFRTGQPPAVHGIIANGFMDRTNCRTSFWEQAARQVTGARIWDGLRARGGTVAMLFWQQSLGERADLVLSPAPIHKHHGGMIQDCYSQPAALYPELRRRLGRPFELAHYWGPLASVKSSEWIARATCEVLAGCAAPPPDLCLTYLPALDYDLQRHGPDHPRSRRALAALLASLLRLREACHQHGYQLLVYGDYAITACHGHAVFPNQALRAAGLLATRSVRGMCYADLHASRAFAVADHQIAHVYVRDPDDCQAARAALRVLPGVGQVLEAPELDAAGLNHARSGELLAVAAPGHWLAYPWWERPAEAPDYAGHVDIHSKPGYDPCELFWGWPPGCVSRNPQRIRGTHGLVGSGHETCWAASWLKPETLTLGQLSARTQQWLETTM